MYSGDEQYGDEITSGVDQSERFRRREKYPTIPGSRVVGSVICKGCGALVQVRYPYSNSNASIGIIDHTFGRSAERCSNAGIVLIYDHNRWSHGSGYLPEEIHFDVAIQFTL